MTIELLVAVVAILIVGWGIFIYNRLVSLRQKVKEGWSGIDVQLKRRINLVPNLVAAVEKYATHEKKVLSDVTEMRVRAQNAENAPS